MGATPPIPEPPWGRIPPDVQAALAAAFDRIERRVAESEQRIGRDSTDPSGPPPTDPPSLKRRPPAPASGKERGGQPGHHRRARPLVPPEAVRRVIGCKPPQCRWCGDALAGDDPEPLRHQVAEVPPVRPAVGEYRPHRLTCPRCRTTTRARPPPGVPAGAFGPRPRAVLSVPAGAYRLGKRPVRQSALDLPGLSIPTGMIGRPGRRGAAEPEAPVEGLREHLRAAAWAHIDETSWRQGRDEMWLRAAVTKSATAFTIARSRGADVARGLLGTAARKVVISDRSEGYGWIKRRQLCRAHPRRDFRSVIDRGGEAGEVGRRRLDHSGALSRWWHRVRDGAPARSSSRLYASWLRPCLKGDLERGAACSRPETAGTCRGLLTGEAHPWTFVRVEGIEPANDGAERALRHGAIYRELSGGTDSESGSRFVERMPSVVATCRQRGINLLDYLTGCCEAHLGGRPAPSLIPSSTAQAN